MFSLACKKVNVNLPANSNICFHSGTGDYVISSVIKTTDGGYLASGFVPDIKSLSQAVFLLKYDGNGKESWYKIYNMDFGYFQGISETSDGGFVVIGESGVVNTGGGGVSLYPLMFKTYSNGDLAWRNHPNDNYYLTGVCSDKNGFIYLCGNNATNNENFLYKIKNNSDSVWYRKFVSPGAANGFNCMKMIIDNSGTLIMAATVDNNLYVPQMQLIKFDVAGKFQKSVNFPGINSRIQYSQMPLVFYKMEQEINGSYHFVFNAISPLGSMTYGTNVLHDISTDQNLNTLSSKRLDSICPTLAYADPSALFTLDNSVAFSNYADNSFLFETIPSISHSSSGEYQGKYSLIVKDQNDHSLSQQAYDGWPCGIFLDNSEHLFICGLTLNPLNETRGIFSMYLNKAPIPD